MIAQLLNREFMVDALDALVPHLEAAAGGADDRRGGEPHPADAVDPEDFATAAAEARATLEREAARDAPAPEAGAPPVEDYAFVPRDVLLSILQSTLEEWIDANDLADEGPPADDRRGGGDEVMVTDRSIKGLAPETTSENRRWFGPFETAKPLLFSDPLWLSSGVAMGIRMFRGRHDFNDTPAEHELDPGSRLVVVGDWGSGIPRAIKVAQSMRTFIEEGMSQKRPVHVVHLGDVYYSGFAREYERRFLPHWPVQESDDDVFSWTLSGNHDMYAGGYGYFDTALADPRFHGHRSSSWFRLRNDDWQIIGLDTGWEDGGLKDPQPQQLADWTGASRSTMLLSHHQPFSVYGHDYDKVSAGTRAMREAPGGLTAWLWGHEHGCILYAPHEGVRHGRCVGNGGIPEYMTRGEADPYPPPATWELREVRPKSGQPWNTFGFAVLDLDGPAADVRYLNEDGVVVKTERIE